MCKIWQYILGANKNCSKYSLSLPRALNDGFLKMADFGPVHCLFLHLLAANHKTFRTVGHFHVTQSNVWDSNSLNYLCS